MTKYKTIIFDLDGTLIHSAPDIHAAINLALVASDRAPLDLPTVISFIGNGVEKLVDRSLTKTGGLTPDLQTKTLALFLDHYTQNMTTLTRPFPGVFAVLDGLKSAGLCLGVCTNKPTQPARDICDQLGLSPYFDVISGAAPDMPKKPDAQPLLRCLADLGGSLDDALYVGDSVVDYETARNAGMQFRLFSGGYLNAALPDLAPGDRFDDWADSGIV
ncbi:MAG: phosphoglycolate phosphatase [Marinosulfonomonas sp.]